MKIYGPYKKRECTDGSHAIYGWYYLVCDEYGELLDQAGPFDEELDCLMAIRRAECP